MVRSQVLRNPEQYRQLLGITHAPPAMSSAPRGSLRAGAGDDEKHDASGRSVAPSGTRARSKWQP
jgi:hypothetical protein